MMPSGLRYDGDDGLLPREEGLRGTPDLPDVPSACPDPDILQEPGHTDKAVFFHMAYDHLMAFFFFFT